MAVDQGILDAVASTDVKSLGEGPAFFANLAMANAVSHQQSLNTIGQAALGSIVKGLTEMDVEQAVSVLKASTGNDLASAIVALAAALGHTPAAAAGIGTTAAASK